MIVHTHTDLYSTDPKTGKPAQVRRFGQGIALDRRSYGRHDNGQPILDADGADGADTITAVMFDTGREETFDLADVEIVEESDNRDTAGTAGTAGPEGADKVPAKAGV